MKNCDDCGRLVKTTKRENHGDTQNLCDRCLEWYDRVIDLTEQKEAKSGN